MGMVHDMPQQLQSSINDHQIQVTLANIKGRKLEILWKYENVTTKTQKEESCWKNGASRLVQQRAVTNLQFVKNTLPLKHNKVKYNNMRYLIISGLQA